MPTKGKRVPSKGIRKICSRGHIFYKSRLCPVCPICWPGYRKKLQSDFPEGLGAPALRALANAKIKSMKDLSKWTEKELADLHGMGPKGIKELQKTLKQQGLRFKTV